jgi:arabinogalactan oligomer/maltooligosaccharide transport system permease protein
MTGTQATIKRKNPFRVVLDFFKDIFIDFAQGDIFVKLSLLVMGAGYFRRGQIIKGLIVTVFQVVIIFFAFTFAAHYLSRFGTLGTVEFQVVFNSDTMRNEFNDFDHSFQILLYGIVSIIVLTGALFICLKNIRAVRALELRARQGKRIPTFIDDIKSAIDEKFYITLLSLPCIGICLFLQ